MATLVEQSKPQFDDALEHLKKEMRNVRSGRASGSMVEDVPVEAYGSMTDIKSLASISTPDPRTIQIEPWDANVVKDLEKAIQNSNLGLTPNTAGKVIRLILPTMTEENRKNLVKAVHQRAEEGRIRIRNIREEIRDTINAKEKAKEIGEDEKFRLQEQLDKMVTDVNAQIEKMASDKETEIMTI